jgi:serine/threonine protein kinase
MPSEQAAGDMAHPSADIYALGVVLFEMLANRLPYAGSSEPTVLRRLLENDPEPWRRAAGLPAPLGPIIRAATHPNPAERTATAGALHTALLPLRNEARARDELSALVVAALAAAAARDARDAQEAPTVAESK